MTFSPEENLEEYVYHPINAFNLLKRCASIGKWIPKLNTSIQFFNSKEDSFALEEDFHNSHLGIAAINEYVDIDTNSIAKGTCPKRILGNSAQPVILKKISS